MLPLTTQALKSLNERIEHALNSVARLPKYQRLLQRYVELEQVIADYGVPFEISNEQSELRTNMNEMSLQACFLEGWNCALKEMLCD